MSPGSPVVVTYGIPTPGNGAVFRVTRHADLFSGGTMPKLTPGEYTAGDTIVCERSRRVYLELYNGRSTSVAVVGLFMEGRTPACVDWRVTAAIGERA